MKGNKGETRDHKEEREEWLEREDSRVERRGKSRCTRQPEQQQQQQARLSTPASQTAALSSREQRESKTAILSRSLVHTIEASLWSRSPHSSPPFGASGAESEGHARTTGHQQLAPLLSRSQGRGLSRLSSSVLECIPAADKWYTRLHLQAGACGSHFSSPFTSTIQGFLLSQQQKQQQQFLFLCCTRP